MAAQGRPRLRCQVVGWPHCPQNRAPAGWLALQFLQACGSTAPPHCGQKRELAAMDARQPGQTAATAAARYAPPPWWPPRE